MRELCTGKGVLNCFIQGPVKIIKDPSEAIGKCRDCIIVTESPTPDIAILVRDALGIVTKTGGLTCHVALVCLEMGKPAIVGAQNIFSVIEDGMNIAIESNNHKGIIYAID